MNRETRFDLVLRHLMSGGEREAVIPAACDGFDHALDAIVDFWAGSHEACAEHAALALKTAEDPDAVALARAASGLAIAGWLPAWRDPRLAVDPHTGGDPLVAALADLGGVTPAFAPAIRGLLGEAALACARVDMAVEFLDRAEPLPSTLFGRSHPFVTFLLALAARTAAFNGDIARAQRFADEALASAQSHVESMFALSCSALVRGNADERTGTRALLRRVAGAPPPTDAVSRGVFVLAAYGAIALGETELGAALVLESGADADLAQLRLIDRAIGFELLVASAVATRDLDSAESWLSRMTPLATHRITSPVFDRVTSRVLLLAGDARGAVAAAERAIHSARGEGRAIEAAEGEILRARARIGADQRGEAARELASVVSDARAKGHLALHRAAARELRIVGRRLPPVTASGWAGLSSREREVAVLVASGHTNASLAQVLFLSEHTVRIHVSRVLQAFGVATRSGVAAALAPVLGHGGAPDERDVAPPALTPRQQQVVALLATGASNRDIAAQLSISDATVEKHVSAVMRRWRVTSRTGIVALAVGMRGTSVA